MSIEIVNRLLTYAEAKQDKECVEWLMARSTAFKRQQLALYIRRAFDTVKGPSDWARCKILAKAIHRFETDIWPRYQFKKELPPHYSELLHCLFLVFKVKSNPPTSCRQLYRIINGDSFESLT